MVSLLWKACSEGDLQNVHELLKEATSVDIEIKDHTGVTPLIEAIKNGHVEVVRALLDKGADPINGSSQARPEQYTSDAAILELLTYAQNKTMTNGIPSHEPVYTHDAIDDPEKHYGYGQSPPVAYTYYPSLNSAPPPPPEGGIYYPQPPPPQATGEGNGSGGIGNLPPPEVARFIPCRYFPACRYGASCLFAHPQTPYYQGSMPAPAQYVTPYDPMSVQPYPQNYYALPSFQPPNGAHHMAPLSPPVGQHPGHGRSPSEVVMPQPSFSPNGIPPTGPYGPMSPSPYSHPGQPPIPMSIPPLPQLPPQLPLPAQPQPNMYNTAPAPPPPFVQHDGTVAYPTPQSTHANLAHPDVNGDVKPPLNTQPDIPGPIPHHPGHREGMGHHRRGAPRRGSFGGRKPPCLFFPTGRCKNGDECRFPHVLPDGSGTHQVPYFSGRGGPRPRHVNGNGNGNGFHVINEKLAGMTVRDDASPPQAENMHSPSVDHGRPRFPQGPKNNYVANGVRPDKRPSAMKQRVPNADEFPVLAGSTTPPTRAPGLNGVLPNGNGHAVPTAAQVLQAPPPRKDSSKESSTRGTTPDPVKPSVTKAEPNGVVPVAPAPAHDHSTAKLPVSFAAVAAPEMPKEITLSA